MNNKTIHPVVTLKNGLRIANFSSPHPFTFDDGTILPACPEDTVVAGKLEAIENSTTKTINGVTITDVELTFRLTDDCRILLHFLINRTDVDIILVPLPVKEALLDDLRNSTWTDVKDLAKRALCKCRVVRVKDRLNKIIFSDKFCI